MKYKNRVKDTTSTTGTGNITLDAAVIPGFQNFSPAYSVDDFFPYCISASDGNWEVGVGKLLTATTFQRHTIFESTNANAALVLPIGSHEVIVVPIANQHDLFGYVVGITANQPLAPNTDVLVTWDRVLSDPLGLITPVLPNQTLVVPDWADYVQITLQAVFSGLISPSEANWRNIKFLDPASVAISELAAIQETLGSGTTFITDHRSTPFFNPETPNGRGIRIAFRQTAGGTANIGVKTLCQVVFK